MASVETIPKTMFAWRKYMGDTEPHWDEVPVPSAPATGFLCKMLASGLCHSDRALLDDAKGRPGFWDRYILGHEGCGQIIEIGSNVTDDRYTVGEVIAMLAVPGCGKDDCDQCSQDVPQLCPTGHHSGIGQDGYYAPYATIDVRGAVHVPKGVTPAQAAVATDAVMTAYHAIIRRGQVKKNETVFLFGLGGLGFNALQVIHKVVGARVIVSDIRQERLDAAAELGIPQDDIVPVGKSVPEFIVENGLSNKIDASLDFVGEKQTFEDAQEIVRIAGRMVCVGTLSTENIMNMKRGIRKRLTVIFSYGGQREDLEQLLDLIDKGVITPQTEEGQLEDFPRWLQDLCDGKVKARVALKPSQRMSRI